MIYRNWMQYIRGDVKLTSLVIPSAHNAGSYGLAKIACCQDGDLYTQYRYGIRHFCIRLDTDKKGNIVLCHGVYSGDLFENALKQIKKMIEETESEFFIFDVREYYPQKVGFFTIRYKADADKVNALIEQYIQPDKYAYTDFTDITDVTMDDIRKSGKRYLLINYKEELKGSVNCPHIIPWDKMVNGSKATDFVRETLRFFDDYKVDGLYWFQTQQTPNIGTPVGFTTPRKLDTKLRGVYYKLIEGIANNPLYLEKANIISGDFMTEDYLKCRQILMLNILKNNVASEWEKAYFHGLWRDHEPDNIG